MKLIFKLILLLFLIPQVLFGTDYYIRCLTGSDGAAGTSWGAAWASVQNCLNNASSGDFCNISSNETCTAGFDDSGVTIVDANDPIVIQGSNDGGSNSIEFPDNRSDIENVAVFDFSGSTTAYHVTFSKSGQRYIWKNIKTTVTNVSQGIYINSTKVLVSDSEFNDSGLSGAYIFFRLFNAYPAFKNVYFNKANTTERILYNDSNGGSQGYWEDNYFNIATLTHPFSTGKYSSGNRENLKGNIFKIGTNSSATAIVYIECNVGNEIINNTFLGNSQASLNGVRYLTGQTCINNKDNVFFEFDGSGAIPIKFDDVSNINFLEFGNNGYYNSNSPDAIDATNVNYDLTSNDISKSIDPFVDELNDDYTLISAERGTATNGIDIGAIQSESGGGGSTVVIPHGSIQ